MDAGHPPSAGPGPNWPQDEFGKAEVRSRVFFVWGWALALVGIGIAVAFRHAGGSRATLIAYIAQDQVYAEPILADFTHETGIRVRSIFDSEAVKTVAIANRLLAERAHPRCDVFWGNEELRTRQLAAQGVFRPTNGWAAVGYRSRRLVIHPGRLSPADAPRSLLELTNSIWRGQIAMAYPIFGTTAAHFLCLRQHWGAAAWEHWCRALQANRPFLVDGNSVVVQFVARGQARIGLTDSDDISAAEREGSPVRALPLNDESLLIPNTVAVVRDCPHPEAAQKLSAYLRRRQVIERLVAVHALEGAEADNAPAPGLQPDWPALLRDLDPATEMLRNIFLR